MKISGVYSMLALAFVAQVVAQTTVTVVTTQPGTVTITQPPPVVTFVPATQPVVPPVVTPPIVTPPVVTPPIVAPPSGPAFVQALIAGCPTEPGITYGQIAWFNSFTLDANGYPNLVPLIPANAIHAALPGMFGYKAGDATDLNSAVSQATANGSLAIILRGGPANAPNVYPPSFWDQNVFGAPGSPTHPWIITYDGPAGWGDKTVVRPVCQCPANKSIFGIAGAPNASTGKAWGAPMHGIIVDGLDMVDPYRQPGNPLYTTSSNGDTNWAIAMVDTGWGAASDHIAFIDCRAQYFPGGIDLQGNAAYQFNTILFFRDVVSNCYGGPTQPGVYTYGVQQMDVVGGCYAHDGWLTNKQQNGGGMAHCHYCGIQTTSEDNALRWIGVCWAEPEACGLEGCAGGIGFSDLAVACAIGPYLGGGYFAEWDHCVDDAGGGAYDNGTPSSALNLTYPPVAASARGWGLGLDCPKIGSILTDCASVNNSDPMNNGWAFWIYTYDAGKTPEGMPSGPTTVTTNGDRAVGWSQWGGTNSIVLSQAGPPVATLNFTAPTSVLPGTTATTITNNSVGAVVNGASFVTGTSPTWTNPAASLDSYAKLNGLSGGPAAIIQMESQADCSFNQAWEPAVIADYILSGSTAVNP